jgi:hypothetical protein
MTRDPRDYKVEISGISSSDSSASANQRTPAPRPFLSIHFACCGVYQRIYRTEDGKAYSGHCPHCAKPVHFAVGPDGTDARYFRVD